MIIFLYLIIFCLSVEMLLNSLEIETDYFMVNLAVIIKFILGIVAVICSVTLIVLELIS